ncbi:MAG: class IV adenylate cyclase [Candidatus Thorarchaeota archaeon]|nr:MAG: class IV adenylate cyclase [Candidatus Thorarchaeota archaeon]
MEEPYEVEVKLPLDDKDAMKENILQLGGIEKNSEMQTDMYFDHPCRSFSKTDESIRVRHRTRTGGLSLSETGHAPVELTYKGPKIDKTTKTRLEVTVDLDDSDSMVQILQNTGFKHVVTILKHREFYDIDGITASLDVVTDVGNYIELELMAYGKDGMKVARDRILKLVDALGLDENEMVRESYLELFLENTS